MIRQKIMDLFFFSDKFIIVGAHIDSWTKGAVDSGTGYGVIWELARGFGSLVHNGK